MQDDLRDESERKRRRSKRGHAVRIQGEEDEFQDYTGSRVHKRNAHRSRTSLDEPDNNYDPDLIEE